MLGEQSHEANDGEHVIACTPKGRSRANDVLEKQ